MLGVVKTMLTSLGLSSKDDSSVLKGLLSTIACTSYCPVRCSLAVLCYVEGGGVLFVNQGWCLTL